MKNLANILLIFLLAACTGNAKKDALKDRLWIQINFENKADSIAYLYNISKGNEIIDTIQRNANGLFVFSSTKITEAYCYFVTSSCNIPLFLNKGDSLKIAKKGNTSAFDYEISGEGSDENIYLKKLYAFQSSTEKHIWENEWDSVMLFEAWVDSIISVQTNALIQYKDKKNNAFEGMFFQLEKSRIPYIAYNLRYNYQQKTRNHTLFTHFPEPDNDELLPLSCYRNYIDNYIDWQKNIFPKPDSIQSALVYNWFLYDSVLTNSSIRNYVMYSLLENEYKYGADLNLCDSLHRVFAKECSQANYINKLNEYQKHYLNLTEGRMFPELRGWFNDTSYVSSRNLKTKPLLIHFWASWCIPCIQGLENLKSIETKFGENIHILHVSVDSDTLKWKKAIDSLQIPPYHINIYSKLPRLKQSLMLHYIPRYVLLDSKNKIIDAFAKPESEEFENLLKQQIDNNI